MFSKIGYLLRAPVFFILKPEKQIESFDWWSKKPMVTEGNTANHLKKAISPRKTTRSSYSPPLERFSHARFKKIRQV